MTQLTKDDHEGGIEILDELVQDRRGGHGLQTQPCVGQRGRHLDGQPGQQGHLQVTAAVHLVEALVVVLDEVQRPDESGQAVGGQTRHRREGDLDARLGQGKFA